MFRSRAGRIVALLMATFFVAAVAISAGAQGPLIPWVRVLPASELSLPGPVDSNSPAILDPDGSTLHVFTSSNGIIERATGPSLDTFGPSTPVTWTNAPPGHSWMESILTDDQGTLYGYYHDEVPPVECPADSQGAGAARIRGSGATWQDLGVILESSEPSLCETTNVYDVGGGGDFSVMLDRRSQFVYFLYSEYGAALEAQGVAVARGAWADRDAPVGALDVWSDGVWRSAEARRSSNDGDDTSVWTFPTGTPVYPALRSWHSADGTAGAMWGPSVHWNTFLNEYVILLNHATSVAFDNDGIYVAYAQALENVGEWSRPQKLLAGAGWYPQVFGLTGDAVTDKLAGQRARFYVFGTSVAELEFVFPRRGSPPLWWRSPRGKLKRSRHASTSRLILKETRR
jgi:hypothetical protein